MDRLLARRIGLTPKIVSLNPGSMADLRSDVRRVAAALGVPERGELFLDAQEDRFARAAAPAAGRPRRSVVVVEWMEPLMSAGNWTPTLVARAGGEELFGRAGLHSGTYSWEDLRRADPEALVVAPCGFDLARTRADLAALTGRPDFAGLRAVREGRAYLADGNAYFNRPGPRVAETLEALVEMIHPEARPPVLEGVVWERLVIGKISRPG